jgi:hypothetical protein
MRQQRAVLFGTLWCTFRSLQRLSLLASFLPFSVHFNTIPNPV